LFVIHHLDVKVLRRPVESALTATIAVVHDLAVESATFDGHDNGVDDQFCRLSVAHRPADDCI
jgi:hypothetical protein